MQIIVVSNAESKRTEYFIEAGRKLQTEIRFLSYEELFSCLPTLRQAVIKLEPWVSEETDFLKYAQENEVYIKVMLQLAAIDLPEDVHFFNPPGALLRALDKKETKRILLEKGIKTPALVGVPRSWDELAGLLSGCGRGCFLKPRYGSGAGGVMAVRCEPRLGKWVAYTTLQRANGVVYNTKRIHRLTAEKVIRPLAEAVMKAEAILEKWIPKEQLERENYDLRVVCSAREIHYVVARCSQGNITNLHLNNNARSWDELPLSEDIRQKVYSESCKAAGALNLHHAGVDVLIERGTGIPYIIEVNGQGDHIYQDMFARNSIYTRQIKTIQEKYNYADR